MIKNITNVRGIKCWGAHSGIKSMRRDLAIIVSEVEASVGAVFTQNTVRAAPIEVSERHAANGKARALVINAGNANACTGEQGMKAAELMTETLAEELGIDKSDVLVSSTGLIGEPFPTNDILEGIRINVNKITNKSSAGSFVANAILTTDTFAKEGFLEFDMDGFEVNMGGIAKGSGMIHPNMATMLGFIMTDAAISPSILQLAVKRAVDKSFNMITVDGDTSTNDMVAVLANGLAGNDKITSEDHPSFELFYQKLEEMMIHLAKLIVSDGEGSSKFIEYKVLNAESETKARRLARTISDSSLVKTAMFGRDPNWGRIVCAAGNTQVAFDYQSIDLYLGNEHHQIKVLENGIPQDYDRNYMKKLLRESQIAIRLDMKEGSEHATAWGADLTTDYVMFNSVYTT